MGFVCLLACSLACLLTCLLASAQQLVTNTNPDKEEDSGSAWKNLDTVLSKWISSLPVVIVQFSLYEGSRGECGNYRLREGIARRQARTW